MHPGAWILWSLGAALVTMSTTNPFYLLPVLGAAWVVHAAHRNAGPHSRSFRIFLVFGAMTIVTRTLLVFLFPASVTTGAIANAFLEGLRLAVLLTVFGAFNSVADPFGVLRLAPRRFHEPALAAALALSIAPRTIASVSRVREAQRMRGIEIRGLRALPALAVPVLETGMEDAVTLAESMDARGHGRGRRTRYRPQPWDPASLLTAGAGLASATVFLMAMTGDVPLVVSTFPLAWPQAAGGLVGAACLLGLPAFLGSRT